MANNEVSTELARAGIDLFKAIAPQLLNLGANVVQDQLQAKKELALKELEIAPELQPELQKEQNRHEEFIISEQRKLIEKFIDANMQKFNSKIDFLRNQQQSFNDFYQKELSLLTEHISYLESERTKAADDKTQYIRLSEEITKLEDSKLEMKREYNKASNQLTDAIKVLEVEMQFSPPLWQPYIQLQPQTTFSGDF